MHASPSFSTKLFSGFRGFLFSYFTFINLGISSSPLFLEKLLARYEPIEKEVHIDRKNYWCERLHLTIDGESRCFHGLVLGTLYKKWKRGSRETPFIQHLYDKVLHEEGFKEELIRNKLRLFREEELEKMRVHFKEGQFLQIGLNNQGDLASLIPAGNYIFVLQKVGDQEALYMHQKEFTEQGRIQHSSFFYHLPLKSAGRIILNEEGRIEEVIMRSGHFTPSQKNIAVIRKFLAENIPKEHRNFSFTYEFIK